MDPSRELLQEFFNTQRAWHSLNTGHGILRPQSDWMLPQQGFYCRTGEVQVGHYKVAVFLYPTT